MDYHREIHRQGCGSAMPQNIFILILFLILFLILASSPEAPSEKRRDSRFKFRWKSVL
jgi:hypothetical protein